MNDAANALLELQEVDAARDRLNERKERLPLKDDLVDVNSRIAEVQAAIDRVTKEADELEREERRVEEEVRLIEEKIAAEEKKLYSGDVVNPKELSALTDEIDMLKRRKAPLEETGLEELEMRDQLLAERDRLNGELDELREEAGVVQGKIDAEIAEIDGELSVEDAKRAELTPMVGPDVLDSYEGIRETKRGIGVGALEGGMCTACRESLSAVEVDKIRSKARGGEWLFRCEHCRRLLVVK